MFKIDETSRPKRYVMFVFSEMRLLEKQGDYYKPIVRKINIPLPKVVENEEGGYDKLYTKLGLSHTVGVDVLIKEIYTRSVNVEIKFEGYVLENLFYAPYNSSPVRINDKFYNKLGIIVEKHLFEHEGIDYFINKNNETN